MGYPNPARESIIPSELGMAHTQILAITQIQKRGSSGDLLWLKAYDLSSPLRSPGALLPNLRSPSLCLLICLGKRHRKFLKV